MSAAVLAAPRLTVGEWAAILRDPTKDKRYLAAQLGGDLAEYLCWAEVEAGKAPRTLDQYERDLARGIVMFPDLPRDGWRKDHIRQVIASFPEGSRSRVWSAWSDFWRWQYEEERVERNPMRGIRRPRKPSRKIVEVFTDTERARLVEGQRGSLMPTVDRCRQLVLLETGVRKNEARLMRVRDLNVTDRYLIVRNAKGGDERIVPFGDDVQRAAMDFLFTPLPRLGRLPEPDDYLFFSSGATGAGHGRYEGREPRVTWVDPKRPMAPSTFHRWWTRCVDRAGVSYRKPHTTRHTYATDMLDATRGDLVAVKEALGHRSVSTTEFYVHNQRARLRDAVAALERSRDVEGDES